MERLSDRAIEIINELHRERLDYESEYLPLIDCANKCQAYEDTGLEPEEVKRVFNEETVLKVAGQLLGITPDRLRELAQADRERHAKHYRWMAPVCVGCPGKTEEGECNGVLRIPGQRGALY